jgi:hypothetical protein
MASRGRVSLGAWASNSDSVRSAQSAAHTASTRRSSSLSVKAPGGRFIPGIVPSPARRWRTGWAATGSTPTVVEVAPALRGGGYAVYFRGPAHLTVLERIGVLEELRRLQTGGSPLRFVDESGVGGGCFHA